MVINFEQVHNYYERLVFEDVARQSEAHPAFTADMLADVACVAQAMTEALAFGFAFVAQRSGKK